MKARIICLLVFAFCSIALAGDGDVATKLMGIERVKVAPDHSYPWYREKYPYMIMKDSVFSAESEFQWPKGFGRIAEKKLTAYQNWVAHLPLWHSQRAVGSQSQGFVFTPDKVARPIHLNRWKSRFSDQTIALRLWAQYLEIKNQTDKFVIKPTVGANLRYQDFLANTLSFGSRGEVVFTKSDMRTASHEEFMEFFELCDQQSNYKTVAAQCDTVSESELLPGDLYITFDGDGYKGKIVFVISMIVDKAGTKLYTVGEGCEVDCDFHIPLMNNDKNYPWISADQIATKVPAREHAGYFRPRIK